VTAVLVAVGSVLALLVALAATVLISRRAASVTEERIARALADTNERLQNVVRELGEARVEAEHESRRGRAIGELAGSIELDEVLARTLESASALSDVDAALVSILPRPGERRLVATLGLAADEAEREGVIAGPPDGRPARSVAMEYTYSAAESRANSRLIRAGLAVPLVLDDEEMGHIAVFTRSAGRAFGHEDVETLEELAVRAAPAIDNARRYREARQLADLDALTGLHNRRYFHETLAREIARAHRYSRNLALVVMDIDDFKTINDRIGHLAGDTVLAETADRVRDVVRSADVACRVGGDELAVILPESNLADADQLYQRLQQSVSSRPMAHVGTVTLSAGVAELRPEDDAASFFERADGALYRAKERGKAQVAASGD
jgi:diguanylate cyclase (GGDEF)-like protein